MSPGPGHYHVGLPSAALRTDEPLAPIEDTGAGAIPSSHLGGVWLDLMLARLAPHDKPHTGRGGLAGRAPAPTPSAMLARHECPDEAAQAEHGVRRTPDKFLLEGIKIFPRTDPCCEFLVAI